MARPQVSPSSAVPWWRPDRWISRALSYEPGGDDVVKWIEFARRVSGVMLGVVIAIGGLSAVLSTQQAHRLLRDSLTDRGGAIAGALARAAFVPLTLEDRKALGILLESYRGVADLAGLRVRDAAGQTLAQVAFLPSAAEAVKVRAEVKPLFEQSDLGNPLSPIGEVEVELSPERIETASRRIAWLNILLIGALASVIYVFGLLFVRNTVRRLQELVGEARLVAQVRQANAELESFSYSVSHDLRAPLRSITGFGQLLRSDSSAVLDETGKHRLERIVHAARRMSELIDDLLALSRVTRREMKREPVTLSALADAIFGEFRLREPGRRVETHVQPGLSATGDPHLLRVALENLLGNAWKYTSKTAEAKIEFGACDRPEGGRAYFVKDNGAGFDMAYSNKLFGPFQRLHSEAEFEGTGIGLATVHRVIVRHGGRVWAEAAVGCGATFLFTLEEKS